MNINIKEYILYEDPDIIVCHKPPKIAVQTNKSGVQDMVSLLKNYLYRKMEVKKEPYIAVIHRLDQPVEGILVFAKTADAAKELNRQLQNSEFGKFYQAVLCNIPKEESGCLCNYMKKDGRTNTSVIAGTNDKDSKKAILHYQICKINKEKNLALVKIRLETGRHHQIRVQMSHIGCPIWGDSKYNPAMKEEKQWRQIALCAYRLEFKHPGTKKEMKFEIEPQYELDKM